MKIFIAGTFDYFHIGHQYLLWNAYHQSKNLVIVVARDKTVAKIKARLPRNKEEDRRKRLVEEFKSFEGVEISLGRSDGNFIKTLKEKNPTHLYLGYDQHIDIQKIRTNIPFVKIKRGESYFPEFFKSSKF